MDKMDISLISILTVIIVFGGLAICMLEEMDETGKLQHVYGLEGNECSITINGKTLKAHFNSNLDYRELVVGDKIHVYATRYQDPISKLLGFDDWVIAELTILSRAGVV